MQIIGKTTDNKEVVKEIGRLYFQDGIPLSLIFEGLSNRGMMPSWMDLYVEMKENGMTHKRIIHLLHEQIFEHYGSSFRDVVIKRLEAIYNHD